MVKYAGLTPPMLGWLGDPDLAIWMFLVVAAWQYTGFMMVLVLAGLQGVPEEIYQAAALDGARGVRAFWYITLPSIRNILIVAVLITSIGAFKVFDLIYVTTRGGPANATQVFGTYIYLQAFKIGNMGYAERHRRVPAGDRRRPRPAAAQIFAAGVMAKLFRFRVLSLAMYGFVAVYSLFVLAADGVDGFRGLQDQARDLRRSDGPARHALLRRLRPRLGDRPRRLPVQLGAGDAPRGAPHRHRQRHGGLCARPLRISVDALGLSARGRLLRGAGPRRARAALSR